LLNCDSSLGTTLLGAAKPNHGKLKENSHKEAVKPDLIAHIDSSIAQHKPNVIWRSFTLILLQFYKYIYIIPYIDCNLMKDKVICAF
jgi:hypothetical protein